MTRYEELTDRLAEPWGTDCIEWWAEVNGIGCGILERDGRRMGAYWAAYEYAYGPVPDGHIVKHANPLCVNPSHMSLVPTPRQMHRPPPGFCWNSRGQLRPQQYKPRAPRVLPHVPCHCCAHHLICHLGNTTRPRARRRSAPSSSSYARRWSHPGATIACSGGDR